jgi:bifunctional ADP-heptose synthase (sugar kinase/adenylyltransferase)
MTPARFDELTSRYTGLRLAVVGDFCLDRYLEIDPTKAETSIETNLPVHNVVNVRAQPGAAGTVLNNLVALGVGTIFPVGFCGDDGEGFELRRALGALPGVQLDHFLTTPLRRTFTYCKPLVLDPGQPPRELNRLDSKNWTPTPPPIVQHIVQALSTLRGGVDAVIVMDQVDVAETGVVSSGVLPALTGFPPTVPVIADSRRGLRDYPAVIFKMNAAELRALIGGEGDEQASARALAAKNGRTVFVTMAERGIIGAAPDGSIEHLVALPLRGPIDVVGAGDSVTANLATALAAGANTREAIELAIAASSLVIHQLGTTGTANVEQLRALAGTPDPA